MRAAQRNGWSRDDSEDLAGEAIARCLSVDGFESKPTEVRHSYGRRTLHRLMIDRRNSPARQAAKLVNWVVHRPEGINPIEQWKEGTIEVVGFRSQRSASPLREDMLSHLEGRLTEFLHSPRGLDGDEIAKISTRRLIEKLLVWTRSPMTRFLLIELLTKLKPALSPTFELLEDDDAMVPPPNLQVDWSAVVDRLCALPFRMRVAILLAMEAEDISTLFHKTTRGALQKALPDWPEPPPLEALSPRVEDTWVAEKLAVTKGNLQVIRNRGRSILEKNCGVL